MATRLRKVRRQRGSRTHGWGQMSQHRHSGSRGGTGMAGMHKHKWSYTVKYAPDHFGHNVFRPPKQVQTKRWLNVRELSFLGANLKESETLDLEALGYDKLLGEGEISKALTIKVPRASESALEKVKAAGGSVELTQKTPPLAKEGEEEKKPEKKGKQQTETKSSKGEKK